MTSEDSESWQVSDEINYVAVMTGWINEVNRSVHIRVQIPTFTPERKKVSPLKDKGVFKFRQSNNQ